MKIVWLCNVELPIISQYTGNKKGSFGGWLDSMSTELLQMNHSLIVMYPSQKNISGEYDNLKYYSFKKTDAEEVIKKVFEEIQPNIIHIWGTELKHSLIAMKIAKKMGIHTRCVVSIQGLVSICGKYHYTEGLPNSVVHRYTLRDLVRKNNIHCAKQNFICRGVDEIELIQQAQHIIGRTDWDKAVIEAYNPRATYYFCNESLRDSFYRNIWDITKIRKHSIFVSQCNYPIKGIHYLLEAMPEILECYPDAHVYTTGIDLVHLSVKQKLLLSSYQLYLCELIKKYGLQKHITFLGVLSEEEMCEQYLKSNVFVSASTIENSPNSVGEAMMVGCPVVSSDVGGIKNMLNHDSEGYIYQSTAPYMLAFYVKKIFADDNLALQFSKNAKKHAMETHNREKNIDDLLGIYQKVIDS